MGRSKCKGTKAGRRAEVQERMLKKQGHPNHAECCSPRGVRKCVYVGADRGDGGADSPETDNERFSGCQLCAKQAL